MSEQTSIKARVFKILNENPTLTGKSICKLLDLAWPQYKAYIDNLRGQWKTNLKNEQGSMCSSVHCWRGFTYVPGDVAPVETKGWERSRARNKFWFFKNRLGRLVWFETGRVNIHVRKPANLGKASQLFADGFFKTELITDVKILEACLRAMKFKSAHFVFDTPQRLPYMNITLFKDGNGIQIKMGDKSDPCSLEVIASYMNWAERWELAIEKILGLTKDLNKEPGKLPNFYSR